LPRSAESAPERAAAVLLEGRGRQWDPQLVDVFLRAIAHRFTQPIAPLPVHLVTEGEEFGETPSFQTA